MLVKSLKINNLRNILSADIQANNYLNVLVGDNGAGKTTVLEALIILAKGRSFRPGHIGSLLGPESDQFLVTAHIRRSESRETNLGLERSVDHWRARVDGKEVRQLSELSKSLPLVLLEPNSHLLVSGPPDGRRRYLDWGVFHVEHAFLPTWQRYSRAIKQRNAALRAGDPSVVKSLDPLVTDLGEQIHLLREQQVSILKTQLPALLKTLAPGLGDIVLNYQKGWRGEDLRAALEQATPRDLERGGTGPGPHRADLVFRSGDHAARESLSRGETKIVAAALIMAQARAIADTGVIPVLLLDDLASEFDEHHRSNVVELGLASESQVWITGTSLDQGIVERANQAQVFHVEHGTVTAM